MFEALSDRLGEIFKKLRGRGKLSEQDVNEAMREVRLALLEADVSLKVVREFISRVKAKAIGEELWKSLTPGQLVVKYVRDELVEIMGATSAKLNLASQPPTVVMLVGLHGSGKTTSTGKLALHLKEKGHRPLLAATDIYRPAAISQLQVLGSQLGIPVFSLGTDVSPVEICRQAVGKAREDGRDVLIIDTAGRLHIDDELMAELGKMREEVKPDEVLLVVDAMTGQDAVNLAERFNTSVGIDGVIMTKLDGDARGGAALSVKFVTGKPIKFIGVGEKLTALEPFHPDRMVGRILGMGDVFTIIDKAQAAIDVEKAQELEKKLKTASFDMEDFLDQLQQVKKMGPLQDLVAMIPGFSQVKELKNLTPDEKQLVHIEAIIKSMTKEERRNPSLLNASRRRRIAAGSGTEVFDVNQLMKQYEMLKKMMKQFSGGGSPFKGGRMPKLKLPF